MPFPTFFFPLSLYFCAACGEVFKVLVFSSKIWITKKKIEMWLRKFVLSELQLLIVHISSGTNWKADLKGILFANLKISFLSLNSGTVCALYYLLVSSMPKKPNWIHLRMPQQLTSLCPVPMWLWWQLIISSWLNDWNHKLIVTCKLQSIKQFLCGVVGVWAVSCVYVCEHFWSQSCQAAEEGFKVAGRGEPQSIPLLISVWCQCQPQMPRARKGIPGQQEHLQSSAKDLQTFQPGSLSH